MTFKFYTHQSEILVRTYNCRAVWHRCKKNMVKIVRNTKGLYLPKLSRSETSINSRLACDGFIAWILHKYNPNPGFPFDEKSLLKVMQLYEIFINQLTATITLICVRLEYYLAGFAICFCLCRLNFKCWIIVMNLWRILRIFVKRSEWIV